MNTNVLMPFLRPLPLPKLASTRFLQRRISSQPCLYDKGLYLCNNQTKISIFETHQNLAAISTPTSQPFPQRTSAPRIQADSPNVISFPPLPYHVHRTASQKLPIYHLAKRGGNLHQTRIRKIEGDVEKLRTEILEALGIKEEHVIINQLTRHIIIKVCW